MELNSESECAESWEHANHLNLRVGHERSVIDFNCTRTFEHDIRMRTAEFSPDLRVLPEKFSDHLTQVHRARGTPCGLPTRSRD
jgi:hypothetical protein